MSTPLQVALVGDGAAVRRLVAALAAATTVTDLAPADHGTSATLQVTVPAEEPVLVFDGLPPGSREPYTTPSAEDRAVAELQARPGEWAHVVTCASPGSARQTASHIRRGKRSRYGPAGAYEAAHRPGRDATGAWWVYARYVGGDAT